MATSKHYDTQIEGLDRDKPNVHILVVQASNANGAPLTEGQMDAALNATVATLEVLGCEVGATLNALQLDPIGENQLGKLSIDVAQEVWDDPDANGDEEEGLDNIE